MGEAVREVESIVWVDDLGGPPHIVLPDGTILVAESPNPAVIPGDSKKEIPHA